jgi:hypothetical protein
MNAWESRLNHITSKQFRPCWWVLLLALLLASFPARADEKDDEYLRIYSLVQDGDALDAKGKTAPALVKYEEALKALRKFKQDHPEWNPKSVSYRLNYLGTKIGSLSEKIANPGGTGTAGSTQSSGVEVKLVEAGAEPRKVLRLHPQAGDKQSVGVTIKTLTSLKMGEMENPPIKAPGVTLTLALTVKEITGDGDISYESSISEASVAPDPDVAPQLAETLKSSLDAVKGLTGTGLVSGRGFSKGTEFKVAPDMPPQGRQAVEQMKETFSALAIPLPEETVGAGAKWEARSQIRTQGMAIEQTATYELVSIDGERVVLKSSTVQSAANQKIDNPAMPGVKIDLKKMEEKGTGTFTLDLTQLLPREGSTMSHANFNMAMNIGAQAQAMSMKVDTALSIESK